MAEAITDGSFPPCYKDHPVVAAHPGEEVLPVNLFVDDVPYSHNDSVVGFWLINCLTDSRYLLCGLRKQSHLRLRLPRLVHLLRHIPLH